MKIPKKGNVYLHSNISKRLFSDWRAAAATLELEFGVWIEVDTEYDINYMTRIYFRVMDHEFESVRDLKKALENKALL